MYLIEGEALSLPFQREVPQLNEGILLGGRSTMDLLEQVYARSISKALYVRGQCRECESVWLKNT